MLPSSPRCDVPGRSGAWLAYERMCHQSSSAAGQTVTLDGGDSYHQDSSRIIDSWQWDLNNDGTFDVSGPTPTTSFPVVGNYPIKLRVTDDGSPER